MVLSFLLKEELILRRWSFLVYVYDDSSFSPFKGRSSTASSFNPLSRKRSFGVVPLALCPCIVLQDPQHFRSSERQATCDAGFSPSVLLLGHFPLTPACPGMCVHSLCGWMSNTDMCQSGFSVPLFCLCGECLESVRTVACVD